MVRGKVASFVLVAVVIFGLPAVAAKKKAATPAAKASKFEYVDPNSEEGLNVARFVINELNTGKVGPERLTGNAGEVSKQTVGGVKYQVKLRLHRGMQLVEVDALVQEKAPGTFKLLTHK